MCAHACFCHVRARRRREATKLLGTHTGSSLGPFVDFFSCLPRSFLPLPPSLPPSLPPFFPSSLPPPPLFLSLSVCVCVCVRVCVRACVCVCICRFRENHTNGGVISQEQGRRRRRRAAVEQEIHMPTCVKLRIQQLHADTACPHCRHPSRCPVGGPGLPDRRSASSFRPCGGHPKSEQGRAILTIRTPSRQRMPLAGPAAQIVQLQCTQCGVRRGVLWRCAEHNGLLLFPGQQGRTA